MNAIALMMEEHKNILKMLGLIRAYCMKILNGEEVEYEKFHVMIDFVRNYADLHHHGKEELILFDKMVKTLGPTADKLITHGMLVEHDLGRLFIRELETAVNACISGDREARLDVIANAVSYTHLLERHIEKEDKVIFRYAEKNLSSETLVKISLETEAFEKKTAASGIQEKYRGYLTEL